jgi:hypothetical protein
MLEWVLLSDLTQPSSGDTICGILFNIVGTFLEAVTPGKVVAYRLNVVSI